MDGNIDKVREALETLCEALELALARLGVCGQGDGADHKADADSIGGTNALTMGRAALSALSAIDPEAIRREFWNELHSEAEAQYDHRHDVLRPVKTYAQSMIVHTMDDGWSAWLLAKRIIENRKAREFNL